MRHRTALLAAGTALLLLTGTTAATAAGSGTQPASHAPATEETAACMADAKPANWDFKLKDLQGKEVALSSFKDSGKVILQCGKLDLRLATRERRDCLAPVADRDDAPGHPDVRPRAVEGCAEQLAGGGRAVETEA